MNKFHIIRKNGEHLFAKLRYKDGEWTFSIVAEYTDKKLTKYKARELFIDDHPEIDILLEDFVIVLESDLPLILNTIEK